MKKVYIIMLLFLVISLTGCYEKPFEKGFDYAYPNGTHGCPCYYLSGIKSDKRVFEIDDVTMDFYFGARCNEYTGEPYWGYVPELGQDEEFVCFATYFYTDVSIKKIEDRLLMIDDYKNIVNFHFINEYSYEEMLSKEMAATYYEREKWYKQGKTVFNYHETLTVPAYLFDDYHDENYNYIYFAVFQINRNTRTGQFKLDSLGFYHYLEEQIMFEFKKIDDNKIEIIR